MRASRSPQRALLRGASVASSNLRSRVQLSARFTNRPCRACRLSATAVVALGEAVSFPSNSPRESLFAVKLLSSAHRHPLSSRWICGYGTDGWQTDDRRTAKRRSAHRILAGAQRGGASADRELGERRGGSTSLQERGDCLRGRRVWFDRVLHRLRDG